MIQLGIVGANGQVGAELCLMLASYADIRLIPICRNRSGSAFLRWQGVACRHGRVADAIDAPRLLADCDVVLNCALATGTPAQIRRIEDKIAENIFAYSKPDAQIIHCSTQSVYGNPRASQRIRWRNPYGRAKLGTEQTVRGNAKRWHKNAYILRLGHVCGSLQEISESIRTQLASGSATLPARDRSSNTVYTAAIVAAVLQIIRAKVEPGTYDLMNSPRWSWREVYEYEAQRCGVGFTPIIVDDPAPSRFFDPLSTLKRLAGTLASVQWARELFAKLFAYVPDASNARAMAWWYKQRAKSEIAALSSSLPLDDHLTWVENGRHFFPASTPTVEALRLQREVDAQRLPLDAWPNDLIDAKG